MMKKLVTLFLVFASLHLRAQDDLMNLLDDEKPAPVLTTATFKGTRLINMHTIETVGKRSLDFRISHRFGDLNGGAYQAFGLDGGASIRLGLEYSHNGRLQFGIGRSSVDKQLDGFVKYRILRQKTGGSMPISVTWVSSMYSTTLKSTNPYFDQYENYGNRLSFCNQVIFGRKFSDRFSLQFAPTMVHFNAVDSAKYDNTMYAVQFAGRFKITKRLVLTAEYCYRLTHFTDELAIKYYDYLGLGIDIETGGHIFQLHFVNSLGVMENQYVCRTATTWSNMGIRLGFNISRVFSLH